MVISGVSVGMEICSKISPVSFPTAHTILVPPASNAPSLMNPSFLRCLARVLFSPCEALRFFLYATIF